MRKLAYILLSVVLLISCENVVELPDTYNTSNQMVLNSVVNADQPVEVSITKTLFLTEFNKNQPLEVIADAFVQLTINEQTEVLTLDSTGQWYVSKMLPQVGDSVSICAIYDGDTVRGGVVVPQKVDIHVDTVLVSRNFVWVSDFARDSAGNYIYGADGDHLRDSLGNYVRDTAGWDMRPLYKATVKVSDPYPQRDGYLAVAKHINEYADTTMSIGTVYPIAWNTYTTTTASNMVLSYLNYNITTSNFTSDYKLNGEQLQFTFSPNFFVNNMTTAMSRRISHIYLVVEVYHLTYDYYRFLATANLSSNYSGNTSVLSLLGEPQHTYCNLEGGLGFMGAQTLCSDTLVMY